MDIARVVANDSTEFAGLVLDAGFSSHVRHPGVSHAGALHRGIIARTHDETFTIRRRRCGDGSSHQTGGDARVHRRSSESMRVLGLLVTSQGVVSAMRWSSCARR